MMCESFEEGGRQDQYESDDRHCRGRTLRHRRARRVGRTSIQARDISVRPPRPPLVGSIVAAENERVSDRRRQGDFRVGNPLARQSRHMNRSSTYYMAHHHDQVRNSSTVTAWRNPFRMPDIEPLESEPRGGRTWEGYIDSVGQKLHS